jgi:hypothetical protein
VSQPSVRESAPSSTYHTNLRTERVAEVRRWLDNHQELKNTIEAIYQLGPYEDNSGFGLLERKEPPIYHLEILATLSCECVIRSQHYD